MSHPLPILVAVDLTNMVHADWFAANAKGTVAGQEKDVSRLSVTRLHAMRKQWPNVAKVVAAVDSPLCFRRNLCEDYKATREAKPEHLRRQLLEASQAVVREFPLFQEDGFEADDVVATLARIATENGYRVVVVSRDKDVNQCLVEGAVTKCEKLTRINGVLSATWFRAADVASKFGVSPSQWADYQALVGDSTDNIHGCDGVGPVMAAKLLAKGTLAELLESPHLAPTAHIRDLLIAFKPRAKLVLDLVTLRTDVPNLEDCLL